MEHSDERNLHAPRAQMLPLHFLHQGELNLMLLDHLKIMLSEPVIKIACQSVVHPKF